MSDVIRAHVLLPRLLVEAVDELVGQRKRSRFVEEAIEEKVRRARQLQAVQAIRESGGAIKSEDYPQWSTPEKVSQWVHDIRRHADDHAMRKVQRSDDDTSAR